MVIIIFICCFVFGIAILIHNLIQKDRKGVVLGIVISCIPLIFIGVLFVKDFIFNVIAVKPESKDLVGVYKIINASEYIEKDNFSKNTLEFYPNGTFYLTRFDGCSICEKGKYEVDYEFENNELSFECNGNFQTAKIKRNLNDFQIVINLGSDFEEGGALVFEKITTK
jgi:hypothetical protein